MNIKILARVVIFSPKNKKLLLVKNKGADFWYPPGGGWEHDKESIIECAKREVMEEVGLSVDIKRMLYAQEFQATVDTKFFELFWFATPKEGQEYKNSHIDLDPKGQVETARWFSREELSNLKVFPNRLKDTFWNNLEVFTKSEDPFVGIH